MAKTTEALVTPSLLTWARRRRRLEIPDLAAKLRVSQERVDSWERGERRPTLNQATKIAEVCFVPLLYLYMHEPPFERIPIADFRAAGQTAPKPSSDLLDLLDSAMGKQEWFREYRGSEGARELSFVGCFDTADQETEVARDVRHTLDIEGARQRAGTKGAFLENLVDSADRSGIMVMRSGVVDGVNSRPLNTDEFRGFAVSDTMAPLVFVNTRDSVGAQIFTLIHEMVHIWTGGSGVSNPDFAFEADFPESFMDRFCNRVAIEALVPSGDFLPRWTSGGMRLQDRLEKLGAHYKVGAMAVLRQALHHGLIPDPAHWKDRVRLGEKTSALKSAGTSGGNFYHNLIARNGRSFTEAVVHREHYGNLFSRDAADLLDIQIGRLSSVAKHLFGSRP